MLSNDFLQNNSIVSPDKMVDEMFPVEKCGRHNLTSHIFLSK